MVSHSPPCHLLLPLALRLLTLSLDRGQDSSAGESHLAHLGLLCFLLHSNASIARPLKLYSTVFEQFLLPYLFHLSVYLRGPGNAYVIVVNPSSELYTLSPGLILRNLPWLFFIQILWKKVMQVSAFRASL